MVLLAKYGIGLALSAISVSSQVWVDLKITRIDRVYLRIIQRISPIPNGSHLWQFVACYTPDFSIVERF